MNDYKHILELFVERYSISKLGNRISDRIIEKMKIDSCIKMAIDLLVFPIQQCDYTINSSSSTTNKYVAKSLDNIWDKLIKYGLKDSLIYGFTALELIWTKENDIYYISDIIEIPRNSLQYVESTDGNFGGVYTSYSSKTIIPKYKSTWFAYDDDYFNVYGKSILESVYEPWFSKTMLQLSMNRYFERRGIPQLIIKYPPGNAIDSAGNIIATNRELAINVAKNIDKDSVIVVENTGSESNWDISELSISDRGDSFMEPLNYYDTQMLRALCIPDRLVTNPDTTGSRADQEGKAEIYYLLLSGLMNWFSKQIQRNIISPIIDINFTNKEVPTLKFESIIDKNRELYKSIIMEIVRTDNTVIDINYLKQKLGIMEDING